jgi:hypothetical protein
MCAGKHEQRTNTLIKDKICLLVLISVQYPFIITNNLMLGAVAGAFLADREARRRKIDTDIIWDALIWVIVGGIIGARLWHVFTPPPSMVAQGITTRFYLTHPLDILAVWNGGLGIPGAVIGGAITLYWFSRRRKISFALLADVAAPAVALGQAIGRWGIYQPGSVWRPSGALGNHHHSAYRLPSTKMWLPPPFSYTIHLNPEHGCTVVDWQAVQRFPETRGCLFVLSNRIPSRAILSGILTPGCFSNRRSQCKSNLRGDCGRSRDSTVDLAALEEERASPAHK